MLFDNFDKKIKEAAEQHHPAYDENAWTKMEGLLNEYLPQQNDRRRFVLLAFAVLLIGGGAFFFLSRPHASSNEQIVQQAKSSTGGNSQQANPNEMAPATEPGTDNLKTGLAIDNPVSHNTVRKDNDQQNSVVTAQSSLVSSQIKQKDQNDLTLNSETSEKDRDVSISKDEFKQDFTQLKPDNRVTQNENAVNGSVVKKDELATNTPEAAVAPANKTPDNNGKPSIKNGFSFFVSTGPDVSKAQNSKAGKVTMTWGLGVAYTLNRITLRTGVFSANKIYWAGPEDYKLSYAPPQ